MNALLYVPARNGSGAHVVSGGGDKKLVVWHVDDPLWPIASVENAHAANVCAVALTPSGIATGSWDQLSEWRLACAALDGARARSTAKLWTWNGTTYVAERTVTESSSVWAVLAVDGNGLLTGCADKHVRLHRDGRCERVYSGHTDCVRALLLAPNGGFLSAANDRRVVDKAQRRTENALSRTTRSRIVMWTLSGERLCEFVAHTQYIYSLAALDARRFVSCGEDRHVNVWAFAEVLLRVRRARFSAH